MEDKISFEELLDLEWKYSIQNDRQDLHLKVIPKEPEYEDETLGTLINFEQCYAKHSVTSHNLESDKDIIKVASMFLHTKEMYKLLSKIDTPEAKELIEKINSTSVTLPS